MTASSQVHVPVFKRTLNVPITRPNAPKLSAYPESLREIEDSHWVSNYGPVNTRLERAMIEQLFGGKGECLTVCNATVGLILALKLASERAGPRGKYVVMPAFTFAAAAHAVLWAGLTPLLIDVDPSDWTASYDEELRILEDYGREVAAIMPYATFGTCLDLTRYDYLSDKYGVSIVVDAAASLGSLSEYGNNFGAGSPHIIIYSMHATKAFGVGEAGLIYSADAQTIDILRRMGNFGFSGDRSASMPGLNSKISEVVALSALIKLSDFDAQISHRATLAEIYRQELPDWTVQQTQGKRIAYQFMPLLIPEDLTSRREVVQQKLAGHGIGVGRYFSPHIYQQPYFASKCKASDLSVTDNLSLRVISLPMSDFLSVDEIVQICAVVNLVCQEAQD